MLIKIGLWIRRLIQAAIALIVITLIFYAIYDYQTDPTRQVYSLDRLHYAVEILPDGSAAVVETRDYTFSRGSFTYSWFDLATEAGFPAAAWANLAHRYATGCRGNTQRGTI